MVLGLEGNMKWVLVEYNTGKILLPQGQTRVAIEFSFMHVMLFVYPNPYPYISSHPNLIPYPYIICCICILLYGQRMIYNGVYKSTVFLNCMSMGYSRKY